MEKWPESKLLHKYQTGTTSYQFIAVNSKSLLHENPKVGAYLFCFFLFYFSSVFSMFFSAFLCCFMIFSAPDFGQVSLRFYNSTQVRKLICDSSTSTCPKHATLSNTTGEEKSQKNVFLELRTVKLLLALLVLN